jgi:hypothetical protein
VQLPPHDCGLAFERHRSPQAWKPLLQVTPHTPRVQVGLPFCTPGQASQEPQCRGSLSVLAQRLPQRVGTSGGQVSVQPKLPLTGAQIGVAPLQIVKQLPQWAGSPRSLSHPSAALQSPKPGKQALPTSQLPPTQATLLASTLGYTAQSF